MTKRVSSRKLPQTTESRRAYVRSQVQVYAAGPGLTAKPETTEILVSLGRRPSQNLLYEIERDPIKPQRQQDDSPRHESIKIEGAESWADVKIRFVLGTEVVITVKRNGRRYECGELGFMDRRTKTRDEQWKILEELADGRGFIAAVPGKRRSRPAVGHFQKNQAPPLDHEEIEEGFTVMNSSGGSEFKKRQKRVQRLNRALKHLFGLKESPIRWDRRRSGWRANLQVLPEA